MDMKTKKNNASCLVPKGIHAKVLTGIYFLWFHDYNITLK